MKNYLVALFTSLVFIQIYSQHIDVHWEKLSNPFFEIEKCAVTDPYVIYNPGSQSFYLFFSCQYIENMQKRSFISCVATKDFMHFSDTLFALHDYLSPYVIQISNRYILSCNTLPQNHLPSQLYYSESTNLQDWPTPELFAGNLTNRIHAGNPAIVYDNGKYILSWIEKTNHTERLRIAIGDSPGGNFKYIGMGQVKLILETGQQSILKQHKGQFIKRYNKWFLCLTEYHPYNAIIYQMNEETKSPLDWQKWTNGKIARLPVESFNIEINASTAFLFDLTQQEGYYYLIYSGCSDMAANGTGNFTLGIARSKDLIQWSVP